MPVVGRRYKLRNQFGKGNGEIVMVVSVDKDFSCKLYLEKRGGVCSDPLPLASFCNICEELPEDNLQETEEEPTTKKNLQVERALEELKLKLKNDFWCESQYHYQLFDSITNLIDALEAEKTLMSKSEPKVDNLLKAWEVEKKPFFKVREEGQFEGSPPTKETFARHEETIKRMKEGFKEERVEPVSIWKDNKDELKKLEKQNEKFLIRTKDGRVIMPIISNYFSSDNQIDKNIKEATTLTDFINSFEQTQKDIEELKRKWQ